VAKAASQSVNFFDLVNLNAFKSGQKLGTKKSLQWYRQQVGKIVAPSRASLMKDPDRTASNIFMGGMFLYFYEAKFKKVLPYWDKFPLTIIIDKKSDGFTGLNMHYLNPVGRLRLFEALLSTMNNRKYDSTTRMKLTYNILKASTKYAAFRPCFKKYLAGHVRSKFLSVPASDWATALFLPVAQFQKQTAAQVWKESQAIIRKG